MMDGFELSPVPGVGPVKQPVPVAAPQQAASGAADILAMVRAANAAGFQAAAFAVSNTESAFRAADRAELARQRRLTTPHELEAEHAAEPAGDEPSGGAAPGFVAEQPAPAVAPAPAHDPRAAARAAEVAAQIAAARAEGHAAGLAEGHSAGLAEGRALGQAEAAERLKGSAQALETAVQRLSNPSGADVAGLAAAIASAVQTLAAQRAGQLIDAAPLPFLHRVEILADRVAQGLRELTLRLNPDDLAAVTPHLASADLLEGARLVADARLARGDVDLRTPGIRLADLLAPLAPAETGAA